MAFYSINDDDIYDRGTERMDAVRAAGGLEGIRIANFILGKPEDNAPVCTVLNMSPGHVLPRHGHNCWRFEVVVQGSITVPDGTVLGTGALMYSGPKELYGQHVAGPEGCTTIEIFSTFDAAHSILVEGEDGLVECDMRNAGEVQKLLAIFGKQLEGQGT